MWRKLGAWLWLGIKILLKTVLLLAVPAFMVYVNFTVDRSGYFQGEAFEREVALALLGGDNLAGYEKMDERQIVKLYVENLSPEKVPDTVALGSSRALQINDKIADAISFFNAGMIGADRRDVMNNLYLFIREGKTPKNVIFVIDPWVLNPAEDAQDSRTDGELYAEFLQQALGRASDYVPSDKTELWRVLADPSYFQGNVEYTLRDANKLEGLTVITPDELYNQELEVKCGDGSVVYTESYRNRSAEEVEVDALYAAGTFVRMQDFEALDADQLKLFDEFIQYGQKNGVNFIFLLIPYHPTTYYIVSETPEDYKGFFEVEPWLRQYAQEHNIPLYGSYDALQLGLTGEDFYDGVHCKGESIAKFFPGVQAVVAQQAGTEVLH